MEERAEVSNQATGGKSGTPLHRQIVYGMIVGVVTGLIADWYWGSTHSQQLQDFVANVTYPAGRIFMRLIFMVVIPLVFSALVLGVAELGDIRSLGRVGLKTLLFTMVLSSISVLVGIAVVNLIQPGAGLAESDKQTLLTMLGKSAADVQRPEKKAGLQIFIDLIPENPLKSMVDAFKGEMLAVMVFSLFIGIAATLCTRERIQPLLDFLKA